ncbi:hypothetical protein ACET3X_005556 [Alternaria dauci]|uniref:LysM domain-containing protein n=1 Tax=Alternaria dauci TaxID=48095 RepID=A0ABR3UNC8_9PLEO
MSFFLSSLLLAGAAVAAPLQPSDPVLANATITPPISDTTIPSPLQPGVVPICDAYALVQPGDFCVTVASANGITLDELLSWNTGIDETCTNLLADAYACVSVVGHTPTPVAPPNGIETPTPIQDGMVGNCDTFHLVQPGENCPFLQREYEVTQASIVEWNPAISSDCTNMWANTYVCVGVIA